MDPWVPNFVGALAGGLLGSIALSVLTGGGFKGWRFERSAENVVIFQPGFLGDVFVGGLAAVVSFSLNAVGVKDYQTSAFWGVFADGVLIGIGGSGFLIAESQRRINDATAKNALAAIVRLPSGRAPEED